MMVIDLAKEYIVSTQNFHIHIYTLRPPSFDRNSATPCVMSSSSFDVPSNGCFTLQPTGQPANSGNKRDINSLHGTEVALRGYNTVIISCSKPH